MVIKGSAEGSEGASEGEQEGRGAPFCMRRRRDDETGRGCSSGSRETCLSITCC